MYTAYAKINLFLHVTGKNQNRHILDSLICKLSYVKDIIKIKTKYNPINPSINIYNSNSNIQDEIADKVVTKMLENYHLKHNITIEIKKNIPIGAGLGGGSSDAATIILALNKLFKLNKTHDQLIQIAQSIGDDVSCFLYPSKTLLRQNTSYSIPKYLQKYHILLIYPNIHISTAEVFKIFSEQHLMIKHHHNKILNILETKNDLEPAVTHLLQNKINNLISAIKQQSGCFISRMTGSGSTCFGIFTNTKDLIKARYNLQNDYPQYLIMTDIVYF